MTARRGRVGLAVSVVVLAAGATVAGQAAGDGDATRARSLAVAREIVQAARYATLATVAEGADPRARVVDPFPPDDDFTIWVATNPRSRKVAELKASPRVTLLYFNAAGAEYVGVRGRATLVTDPIEKAAHWKDEWAAFYAGGPRGPNYLLIKVVPTALEIVSPGRGFDTDPVTWRPFTLQLGPPR
jgi:general stress protein 26